MAPFPAYLSCEPTLCHLHSSPQHDTLTCQPSSSWTDWLQLVYRAANTCCGAGELRELVNRISRLAGRLTWPLAGQPMGSLCLASPQLVCSVSLFALATFRALIKATRYTSMASCSRLSQPIHPTCPGTRGRASKAVGKAGRAMRPTSKRPANGQAEPNGACETRLAK